jgi:hypothetical protein
VTQASHDSDKEIVLETRLSCLPRRRQCHQLRRTAAGPWGAREIMCGTGCHASRGRGWSSAAATARSTRPGDRNTLAAYACGEDACGEMRLRAVRPLSTQLSVTQAKEKYVVDSDADAVFNACQEYERLASLATANLQRRAEALQLAHPPMNVNAA